MAAIRRGDVVRVDGRRGTVGKLGARKVQVVYRDGTWEWIPRRDLSRPKSAVWSRGSPYRSRTSRQGQAPSYGSRGGSSRAKRLARDMGMLLSRIHPGVLQAQGIHPDAVVFGLFLPEGGMAAVVHTREGEWEAQAPGVAECYITSEFEDAVLQAGAMLLSTRARRGGCSV